MDGHRVSGLHSTVPFADVRRGSLLPPDRCPHFILSSPLRPVSPSFQRMLYHLTRNTHLGRCTQSPSTMKFRGGLRAQNMSHESQLQRGKKWFVCGCEKCLSGPTLLLLSKTYKPFFSPVLLSIVKRNYLGKSNCD